MAEHTTSQHEPASEELAESRLRRRAARVVRPRSPSASRTPPAAPVLPSAGVAGPATPPGAGQSANHSAVLDEAHLGDIEGAFGTIRLGEERSGRTWRRRLLTLLAIVGPGLIVMVGDNDAGGVATYSQAGQNFGLSLLWTLPLLIPVLVVNQEMVVRLGAVTGVGHARLINERFGRFWGAFSVGDLFLLNFLTIVTEFIGVSLALGYFGVTPYASVPVAALGLVAITATGSFRRWERFMMLFVVANFLVIPLIIFSHPHAGPILHGLTVPGVRGGVSSTAVLLIIAIVGTTVAPWQLFFQQSNIVDKRITPRFVNYERADTVIGSFITVIAATLIVATAAFAFGHTRFAGHFVNAGAVARALGHTLGDGAGTLYAIVLLNASIIGAASVTLSTSYAFGDVFGLKHSLHRGFADAKQFYAIYSGLVALAAAIVLIPHAPLGVITTSVQALAGVLLPSATVFLLLLCNDKDVLGPWVNKLWLNIVAGMIVAVLIALSLILMTTTVFPHVGVGVVLGLLGAVLGGGIVVATVAGVRARWRPAAGGALEQVDAAERLSWRMPPLALLGRPTWSRGRTASMWALRLYLVAAVLILLAKAIELA
ncbi:MAG TPA: NRAMP family divalent metal transporter [Acidimicrobiales bacterium]|nr:NRAMP family divalent metal transporter [Acidimicrobiales bacterium]